MIDVKYERGKTLTYPTMYPRLLITPVFAHKGDFMWIERIVCKYDSDIDDIEEPEFEFVRSTVHSERNNALKAENVKLRKLVRMQDECIAGNCEWCKHRKNRRSLDVECELDDLARELGIEMDE